MKRVKPKPMAVVEGNTLDAGSAERKLVIRYLHDTAAHWRAEAVRLAAGETPAYWSVVGKVAVLEGVAADIHDGVHTHAVEKKEEKR
jgi:hypothetical protein